MTMSPHMTLLIAHERWCDLVREAEHARLVREAARTRRSRPESAGSLSPPVPAARRTAPARPAHLTEIAPSHPCRGVVDTPAFQPPESGTELVGAHVGERPRPLVQTGPPSAPPGAESRRAGG